MARRSAHWPLDSWRAHVGSAQLGGGSLSTHSAHVAGVGARVGAIVGARVGFSTSQGSSGVGVGVGSTSQGSSGSGVGAGFSWGAEKGSLHGTVTK